MSQDNIVKLVSEGADDGTGAGHIYYTKKNTSKLKNEKLELRKYNPIARTHTTYTEKK
jgi:ribosomal protein L33